MLFGKKIFNSNEFKKFSNKYRIEDKELIKKKPEMFYLDMKDFGIPKQDLQNIKQKYNKLKVSDIPKSMSVKTIDLNIIRLCKLADTKHKSVTDLLRENNFPNILIDNIWKSPSLVYSTIIEHCDELTAEEQEFYKKFMLQRLNHNLDIKLDMKYKSWRWIPLITQRDDIRMLTVEDWNKWYDYYVIDEGEVYSLLCSYESSDLNDLYEEHLFNHCMSPKGFLLAAQRLDARVDRKTYSAVVNMFIEEYYDGETDSIEDFYLPNESLKKRTII